MGEQLKDEIERQLQRAIEEEKLNDTINIINDEILKCIDKRKKITDIILEYRKNMLEEYKDDEDRIIEYFDHESYIKEESFKATDRKLRELTILKSSPYFGRVTFREEGNGIEDIYIGRFGVTKEGSFDPIIVDWRAPVASIFYNATGSSATYAVPDGEIEVSLLGMIQYIIKKGKLEGLFDSKMDIKDEILQMVLSKNSSEKLKDIVMTIQREQDEIIRQQKNSIVIVDGVAGSGKTTIALHRVAYLIYNFRKQLENKVLILGPNRIFIEYISDVLPTLGETGVYQTTFMDLSAGIVDFDEVMDIKEVMEKILNGDKELEEDIRYKRSSRFKSDLDSLIEELENKEYEPRDLIFEGRVVVSSEDIKSMFKEEYISMPLFRRARKIKRILFAKLSDARDEAFRAIESEFKKAKEAMSDKELALAINDLEFKRRLSIREMIAEVIKTRKSLSYLDERNIEEIYRGFNKGEVMTEEDVTGVLYLKYKLQGFKIENEIKHLVIDEAQDYSLLQMEVLKAITGVSSMTIVGDSNQRILPGGDDDSLKNIKELFKDNNAEFYKLNKSYRSTKEIMEYSNRFINDSSIVPMVRTGEPVTESIAKDVKEIITEIRSTIEAYKKEGLSNIAIITRDLNEAKTIYENLEASNSIRLMDRENYHKVEGIMVVPSYYAKGLEFDGVVVVDNHEENNDNLKYIMCTRALHKLHVIKNL